MHTACLPSRPSSCSPPMPCPCPVHYCLTSASLFTAIPHTFLKHSLPLLPPAPSLFVAWLPNTPLLLLAGFAGALAWPAAVPLPFLRTLQHLCTLLLARASSFASRCLQPSVLPPLCLPPTCPPASRASQAGLPSRLAAISQRRAILFAPYHLPIRAFGKTHLPSTFLSLHSPYLYLLNHTLLLPTAPSSANAAIPPIPLC